MLLSLNLCRRPRGANNPWLSFVPVDNRIAVRAVNLEAFPHRDPADRMIVATALGLNATLVTADTRLRRYRALRTVRD